VDSDDSILRVDSVSAVLGYIHQMNRTGCQALAYLVTYLLVTNQMYAIFIYI